MAAKKTSPRQGAGRIRVGILMGSESDRPVVEEAGRVLDELGIGYELLVRSAHRTPDAVREYAMSAQRRGIGVLIAAAGGAAHLAGAVAAHSPLPVIGIPLAATPLAGLDSLLATVQMPAGVPVATVAVGVAGAKNAAHLASRILALGDADLARRLRARRRATEKRLLASTSGGAHAG